jgi:hypothetical protein
MRLDHVSYAVGPDQVVDCLQRLGSAVGASFADGGRHPRFGTRNFVLPLSGGTYLEVVTTLDHPATDSAPFGRAVRQRARLGGGWLGWVVAVEDIAPVERRLDRRAVEGHRRRPDGVDLHWKQIGIRDVIDSPQLPFFVQWQIDAAQHPSSGARWDIGIVTLEVAGDPGTLATWLGGGDPRLNGVHLQWVDADEPGLVAVHFATAYGTVRID